MMVSAPKQGKFLQNVSVPQSFLAWLVWLACPVLLKLPWVAGGLGLPPWFSTGRASVWEAGSAVEGLPGGCGHCWGCGAKGGGAGPAEMFSGAQLPASTAFGLCYSLFFSADWKKDIQNF